MRRALAAAALVLVGAPGAWAQVDAHAELSRDTVALNESIEYRVTVSGSGLREVDEPRVALPIGLTLFGRSRSSEVSIVNGSVERRTTFTFTYRPFQTGPTTIGPATVRAGGAVLRVPPLPLVIVAEPVAGGLGGPAAGATPFPPAPGGLPPLPGAADSTPASAPDFGGAELPPVFVTNRLDEDEVYVGEQVVLTFSFYQSPRAMVLDQPNYASAKTPGFWSQDLNREPEIARELVGGEPYTIQRFYYALFPLTPGEKTIAPATLTLTLRNPVSFLDRGRTRTLSGDTLRLRVRPLPREGRPTGFAGAVGRFELGAAIAPRDPERDAPATLTVTVSGEGNLATIPPPRVTGVPGVRVFDPEVQAKTAVRGTTVRGEKEFRFLLVPHREGRVELGRASLAYFDPQAEEYRTAVADLGALAVRPPSRADGEPLPAAGGELAGIRRGNVRTSALPGWDSPVFAAFAALPLLGLGLLGLRARRSGRPPRARRAAAPVFPDPGRLRSTTDGRAALTVEQDLLAWLEWRHGVALGGLSLEGRERALRAAGAPQPIAAGAGAALRAMEDVGFTPPEARSAALERAVEALRDLRAAEQPARSRGLRAALRR